MDQRARHRSSGRACLVLVVALAAHGCGGGSGGGGSPPALPAPPTSAPPLLQPAASIRLRGSEASGLAEAGGWLWVTHYQAGLLSQIDPRIDAEVGVVEVGANAASVMAVGPQLWISQYTNRPEDSRLTWVDPRAAVVLGRLQPPHLCCDLAGVDPASARVVASIDVGGGIPMAIAHDLVWGASPHHVWAVDPASNEVRVRLPLENTIESLSLAVTADALWVGARRPGYVGVVLSFDLVSQRPTGQAAVSLPARLLHAFGHVWVIDWDSNSLLRFD